MKRTARPGRPVPATVAGSFHLSVNGLYALAEAPVMVARMRKNELFSKLVQSV